MKGFDTNILLRLFVDDDPGQSRVARRLVEDLEAKGGRGFVTCVTLCELAWTLKGYGFSRLDRAAAIEKLLAITVLEIQDRDLVRRAVDQYRQGRADFADYLIGWQDRQAGCSETLTFDRKLRGTPGFSVLVAEN